MPLIFRALCKEQAGGDLLPEIRPGTLAFLFGRRKGTHVHESNKPSVGDYKTHFPEVPCMKNGHKAPV